MCWFYAAEETQIVLSRPECENCPPANWNIYGSSVSPISFIHYVGSWRLIDLFRVSYDLYSIKSCLMNECATMSFLSGWMAVAFSSQSSHCNATRQASRCINALLLNESKYTTIYSCSWALSFPFSCSHQLPSRRRSKVKNPTFDRQKSVSGSLWTTWSWFGPLFLIFVTHLMERALRYLKASSRLDDNIRWMEIELIWDTRTSHNNPVHGLSCDGK